MDQDTNVDTLKQSVKGFVEKRDWGNFHSPKNLAMSIAIEASELMEIFQWSTVHESKTMMSNPEILKAVNDELADVVIYCLSFAIQSNLDLSTAVNNKIEKNAAKYPVK